MKLRKLLAVFTIVLAVMVVGCKDDSPAPQAPEGSEENVESLEKMGEDVKNDAEKATDEAKEDAKKLLE